MLLLFSGVDFDMSRPINVDSTSECIGTSPLRSPGLLGLSFGFVSSNMCKIHGSRADFRFLAASRSHEEGADSITFKGPNDTDALSLTDAPSHFGIPDVWLTAQYPGGVRLSKIATLFALAYALGMLVRCVSTASRRVRWPAA